MNNETDTSTPYGEMEIYTVHLSKYLFVHFTHSPIGLSFPLSSSLFKWKWLGSGPSWDTYFQKY